MLPRIARAVKAGGYFVFDGVTEHSRSVAQAGMSWEVCPSGRFWRPGAHLVLFQAFHYPEERAFLDRYLVIDDSGCLTVYNVWEHYYMVEMLQAELKIAGFSEVALWSDLTGTPYEERAGSLGVIAKK